jgi:hypothetical protein
MNKVERKEKVYPKGTTVVLYSTCNYSGCDSEEEVELHKDMTESELNEMAYEFSLENIQPEGSFEVVMKDKITNLKGD